MDLINDKLGRQNGWQMVSQVDGMCKARNKLDKYNGYGRWCVKQMERVRRMVDYSYIMGQENDELGRWNELGKWSVRQMHRVRQIGELGRWNDLDNWYIEWVTQMERVGYTDGESQANGDYLDSMGQANDELGRQTELGK